MTHSERLPAVYRVLDRCHYSTQQPSLSLSWDAKAARAELDSLFEQLETLQEALREMSALAPVGAANVHENAERQKAHRRAIELLGLPDPGEFVMSDYWLRLSNPAKSPHS